MSKLLLVTALLFSIISCGKKDSTVVKVFTFKSEKQTQPFINQKPIPVDPNLTLDKSIVNNKYPITVALYNDHNFYYDLPNLGDGVGKWEYKDGKIELKAKRTLFDMYIEIYGADKDMAQLAVQFSDRFGPNTLKMDNHNL